MFLEHVKSILKCFSHYFISSYYPKNDTLPKCFFCLRKKIKQFLEVNWRFNFLAYKMRKKTQKVMYLHKYILVNFWLRLWLPAATIDNTICNGGKIRFNKQSRLINYKHQILCNAILQGVTVKSKFIFQLL